MSRGWPSRCALALLLLPGLVACQGASREETWRVQRGPFLHQIRAEGVLGASGTQKLTVPRDAEQTLRLAWLAEDGQKVAAGEVVARFDREPIEKEHDDGQRALHKAELEGDKLASTVATERGGLSTSVEVAELELAFSREFQNKDEQVFSRRTIAESVIEGELAEFRQKSAEAALKTREKLAATEAALIAINRRQAASQIERASKGLEALEVRAPFAGIFLRARMGRGEKLEPGGEMWPGVEVGELPSLGPLQAEVFVLEADAGGLAEGQEAEVRIEADPGRVHRARISRLDASARPRFRGSPVQYFGVSLVFDEKVEAKLGQQVTARLTLHRRDDALLLPLQAIEQRDGKAYARRRVGGKVEELELKLGPASAGRVVVEEGLKEGDEVLLPRRGQNGGGNASNSNSGGR